MVKNELYKDIAKEYRISIPTVSKIVKHISKNKKAIEEIDDAEL